MNPRVRRAIEAVATVSAVDDVDDVVRRAQQGDVEAFERLYRAHSAAIYALCRRMVGTEGEALDLVQDIFVRAWERFTTFRSQSSLATWLHRLGVNVVLGQLRSAKREASRFVDGDDTRFGGRSPAGQVDARIDLESALARLPGGARAVFVLHDIEGYSHEEIARMTGIASGTARAQLWRARRALLRLLDL
jgi:RNA polymerase sigma-70 factor (ECF subfamily)